MKQKQQVLFIHGGEPDVGYDDYIERLKKGRLELILENSKKWNKNQRNFLDTDIFDVITPIMPCGWKAHYGEWVIWFERHIEFMRNDIILVGHSLGGGFLGKWLSENILPVSVKQLHLVAATFNHDSDNYKLSDFRNQSFPGKFFENNIENIYIYHSKDDPEVPILESEKYHEALPVSHLHVFNDRGHFLGETFPELFDIIKNA